MFLDGVEFARLPEKFPESLKSFQMAWKVSRWQFAVCRWSGKFPKGLKCFQKALNVSKWFGIFQMAWKVCRWHGKFADGPSTVLVECSE